MKFKFKLVVLLLFFICLRINFANAEKRHYLFFYLNNFESDCSGDFCVAGNLPTPSDDIFMSENTQLNLINIEDIVGIEWNIAELADSHEITFNFSGADTVSALTSIEINDINGILPGYSISGTGNTVSRTLTFTGEPSDLGDVEITIKAIDTTDTITVIGQETITLTVINYVDEYVCNPTDPLDGIYKEGVVFNIGMMNEGDTPSPEIGKAQLLCISENQAVIGDTGNPLTSDYKLTTDISFVNTDYLDATGWIPLGNYVCNAALIFTGNFNGNHHTISNLYINRDKSSEQGFFGRTQSTVSSISNLGMVNGKITGQNDMGCLVGHNQYTSIINTYAKCAINGKNNLGELIGNNIEAVVNRSYSSGYVLSTEDDGEEVDVDGDNNVGGLIGVNDNGTVSNCYSQSDVTGKKNNIGGLIGTNSGTLSRVYASGSIDSTAKNVGGLVGVNSGTIEYSYAKNDNFTVIGDNSSAFDLDNYCSESKNFGCDGTAINIDWSSLIWNNLGTSDLPTLK